MTSTDNTTAEQMLYQVAGRMRAICNFKNDYHSQLEDLKPQFDNLREAVEFIEHCKTMLTYCEEADEHLDKYMEWLFDNSDGMPEGEYIKQMDLCKQLKETLEDNEDSHHIENQLAIACIVIEDLNQKIGKMKEKKRKKELKKPMVWDKLKVFIRITMERISPDTPIEVFYDELKYISYGEVNITFDEDVKYVRDITGYISNQTRI